MPDYQTIRGISTFEYEEKRSRFIASAAFADTEEAALAHLNRIKAANRTARHNVFCARAAAPATVMTANPPKPPVPPCWKPSAMRGFRM